MTNPMVSVVICTYNGLEDLREVIDDLLAQTYDNYEILIVDNNSTDGTAEYVQQQMKTAPRIRYCVETQQGVSHARNRGIEQARGDIVAYVDDDCRVPTDWIAALVTTYHETQADGVGGPIRPKWDPQPSAFTLKLYRLGLLPGTYHRGDGEQNVDWIAGGNMSLRRDVLNQIGGFNTEVGPVGDLKRYGEEVEFCTRVIEAGFDLLYEPAAWLWHKIPKHRQSLSYVLRTAFWIGVSNALIQRPVNRQAARAIHPLKILVNIFSAAGRLYARIYLRRQQARALIKGE